MAEQVYRWTEDIWSVHVEVENHTDAPASVRVTFEGSASPDRTLRVAPRETMRFNVARCDGANVAARFSYDGAVTLRIFENRDRAFYGIEAVAPSPPR